MRAPHVVDFPRECPKMKDAEYRHFNAEKHGRDADFDVGCLNASRWFDGASGGDSGYEELREHINPVIYSIKAILD